VTVTVAIPVYRVSCKVGIDKGRRWSVIEELLLWSLSGNGKTLGGLSAESSLPRQIVAAAVTRLMRFRLVEVVLEGTIPKLRASEYGKRALSSGEELPVFLKRHFRRISFVVNRVTGEMLPSGGLRLKTEDSLRELKGRDVRVLRVKDGGPPLMSHEANVGRLAELASRGLDEELGFVKDGTLSIRDNQFLLVQITGKTIRGLPFAASPTLRKVVLRIAAQPAKTQDISIEYEGEDIPRDHGPIWRSFSLSPEDVVVGTEEQRTRLGDLIRSARERIILHSTFLRVGAFEKLQSDFKFACRGGVQVDVLWGAEKDNKTLKKNSKAAREIMLRVRSDPDLNGRFRIHMRSTGSHAKLMMLNTQHGWKAAVSTCNWLYSDFDNVEVSVFLGDPALVADVAVVLQHLAGQRRIANQLASDLALTARELRKLPSRGGLHRAALLLGPHHESAIRTASQDVEHEFTIATNRLGSTARPGAIMLAEYAAQRDRRATVFYDRPSGPMDEDDADQLIRDAASKGVRVVRAPSRPGLHGKFVAWDSNDLVVTSLNWGSAVGDVDFPYGEVGLHLKAPGSADLVLGRLRTLLPTLFQN
jgi:cardiolipin synthase A/B